MHAARRLVYVVYLKTLHSKIRVSTPHGGTSGVMSGVLSGGISQAIVLGQAIV